MGKCFNKTTPNAINEAGPKVLVTPTTPRHETPDKEVRDMPFNGQYTDSTSGNNPEHQANSGGAA